MHGNVTKRNLWHYVNLKIKRLIHHYHVFSVISILFEEMLKDLKENKPIKISNFGTFLMKDMLPRKYHNVRFRKVMQSPGHRILRFILAKSIKKKLCDFLDLDNHLKDS